MYERRYLMFKIGDFSKLSMTSVRMLRYYDEQGLLPPAHINQTNGYRYYTAEQLNDIAAIKLLQHFGVALGEIKALQKQNYDHGAILLSLRMSLAHAQNELNSLHSQIADLEKTIAKLERNENMPKYNLELKTIPKRTIACYTKTLARYEDEHELWQEAYQLCHKHNLKLSLAFAPATAYLDDEYRENNPTVQAQIAIDEPFCSDSELTCRTIVPTEVLSAVFTGSYAQINAVYTQMAEWLESHNYRMNGNMFLVYLSNPDNTPAENLVSELCLPVCAK